MNNKVTWLGYEFTVYATNTTWNPVPGVYMFCGLNARNQWITLYVGQAESLAVRLPTHERWPEAVRLGATHIHALVERRAANRDIIEKALIQAYQPRLNVLHR